MRGRTRAAFAAHARRFAFRSRAGEAHFQAGGCRRIGAWLGLTHAERLPRDRVPGGCRYLSGCRDFAGVARCWRRDHRRGPAGRSSPCALGSSSLSPGALRLPSCRCATRRLGAGSGPQHTTLIGGRVVDCYRISGGGYPAGMPPAGSNPARSAPTFPICTARLCGRAAASLPGSLPAFVGRLA